jgi:hypothetical protein
MALAMGLHNTPELGDSPNLETVATSLSMSAFLGARKGPNSSSLKLKEASTLAEILGLDNSDYYCGLNETEREIALTLAWKILVGER